MVANLSIAIFFTAGTTLLPWIAWAIRDWRYFSLITAVPMASALAAYWIVPESARYDAFLVIKSLSPFFYERKFGTVKDINRAC